jgi:hypothetical protein
MALVVAFGGKEAQKEFPLASLPGAEAGWLLMKKCGHRALCWFVEGLGLEVVARR